MSVAVKQNTKIAVEIESTEGVYVSPTGASSFVQTLADGVEIKPTKELLERNVFSGTIGKVVPRTGQKSVSGSMPTECRAHSTEGAAPEIDKLLRSALGAKRQSTSTITTKTGNTDSVLNIQDADIASLNVGDIVLVKESGAFHVSPIVSKTSGAGTATVTLLVAHPDGPFSDNVSIAKFTTYTVAESGHPTLSVTKYVDDSIKEVAKGCRVNKASLENFSTGQIPTFSFGFDGLDFDRTLEAPAYSPSYDTALPPIVLDGRAYVDGVAVEVNQVAFSVENTVGFQTSIAASNGKIASRLTGRSISGTINPYKDTTSLTNYTKFSNNTQFSLFAYAKNSSTTPGEMQNVVAVYMPNCLITEIGEADADGLLQETLSFSASRGSSGTENEIYLVFI